MERESGRGRVKAQMEYEEGEGGSRRRQRRRRATRDRRAPLLRTNPKPSRNRPRASNWRRPRPPPMRQRQGVHHVGPDLGARENQEPERTASAGPSPRGCPRARPSTRCLRPRASRRARPGARRAAAGRGGWTRPACAGPRRRPPASWRTAPALLLLVEMRRLLLGCLRRACVVSRPAKKRRAFEVAGVVEDAAAGRSRSEMRSVETVGRDVSEEKGSRRRKRRRRPRFAFSAREEDRSAR